MLDTDASNCKVGAVLQQEEDGVMKVVSHFSKSHNRAERNYCATRIELLSLVKSCKFFHAYLYGSKFKVRTDHGALAWLFRLKSTEGQLARWLEQLSQYDFTIEHRKGTKHTNADSR